MASASGSSMTRRMEGASWLRRWLRHRRARVLFMVGVLPMPLRGRRRYHGGGGLLMLSRWRHRCRHGGGSGGIILPDVVIVACRCCRSGGVVVVVVVCWCRCGGVLVVVVVMVTQRVIVVDVAAQSWSWSWSWGAEHSATQTANYLIGAGVPRVPSPIHCRPAPTPE